MPITPGPTSNHQFSAPAGLVRNVQTKMQSRQTPKASGSRAHERVPVCGVTSASLDEHEKKHQNDEARPLKLALRSPGTS